MDRPVGGYIHVRSVRLAFRLQAIARTNADLPNADDRYTYGYGYGTGLRSVGARRLLLGGHVECLR